MKPTTRHAVAVGAAVLITAVLSGCEGMTHPEDFPTDGPTATATANPAPVTAADFGHSWGLTVDHGSVGCVMDGDGDPVLTFTAPDGTIYALNSVTENHDRPDIDEIATGSVGTLRTFAFTVCGK